MERLLSQAAAELAIRSEVNHTLTTLLQDVEHAHALEQSLHAHNELHRYRENYAALKVRYEDREAAWEADRREKDRLGRLLLEEIVKLSARETKAEKSKEELELRLRQLEDEKRSDAKRFAMPQQQNKLGGEAGLEGKEEGKEGAIYENITQTSNYDGQDSPEASHSDYATPGGDQVDIGTPTASGGKQMPPDTTNPTEEKHAEGSVKSPATINATEAPNSQEFVPHDLDESTLMEIFAYSDPLDVMNFAQTNRALLSKVNIMFGMGGGEESDVDNNQTAPSSGEYAVATSMENTEPPPPKPPTVTPTPPSSSAAEAAKSSSALKSSPQSSPKLIGSPGPTHRRQGSGTSVNTAASGGSVNRFAQVSSWFSGGDSSSTASVGPAAAATSASTAATSTDTDTGEIKLNAAMATSMASKLTPAELSIILRMREKLQRCEADANKWRLEKEDAVANLASVEAVKEFLVSRVRDTERVVQSQKEDMKETQKKNLEDQEVIVFLDERVKELEKASNGMKSKEAMTNKESADIVNKNEKKVRVLSDMLRFEREQMAVNEKEWKTAKKVLVKEVKSCRARIVALEAEVEGCKQQNSQLKQGLMVLTQSSPAGRKIFRNNGRF